MTTRPAYDVAIGLLGPVTLSIGQHSVPIGGIRQRAVFAALAASTDGPMPTDRLAEAVWSDTGRPSSRSTLQVHVHQARKLLGPCGGALRHTPAGYLLDGVRVDVRAVDDGMRRGRAAEGAGDHAGAAAAYRATLALWRGEYCADLADLQFFAASRPMYESVRLDALEAAIGADLRRGAPGLAVELEALVERHPLRERLWGHLMVALHRDGRQADALGAYRRARAVLADEVGVDPGAALRRLERAILDQKGTMELLRVAAPGTGSHGGRPVLTWLDPAGTPRSRELPASGVLVVGRVDTVDIALTWDAAVSRRHAAIVVGQRGELFAEDLDSRNGTYLNGARLAPGRRPLHPGDVLRCGDTALAVAGMAARGPVLSAHDETRPADG
jgi:SARP family transcriptional regulator, regulator of embCAB operon